MSLLTMTLQSTETQTTGSVAVIAVGPSEANWFMAKKAVNGPKLLVTHSPYNQGKGPNMTVTTLPEAKTKDCLEKK